MSLKILSPESVDPLKKCVHRFSRASEDHAVGVIYQIVRREKDKNKEADLGSKLVEQRSKAQQLSRCA